MKREIIWILVFVLCIDIVLGAELKINLEEDTEKEGIYVDSFERSTKIDIDLYAVKEEWDGDEVVLVFYSYEDFSILDTAGTDLENIECGDHEKEEFDNNAVVVKNNVYCVKKNNKEDIFKIRVLDVEDEHIVVSGGVDEIDESDERREIGEVKKIVAEEKSKDDGVVESVDISNAIDLLFGVFVILIAIVWIIVKIKNG